MSLTFSLSWPHLSLTSSSWPSITAVLTPSAADCTMPCPTLLTRSTSFCSGSTSSFWRRWKGRKYNSMRQNDHLMFYSSTVISTMNKPIAHTSLLFCSPLPFILKKACSDSNRKWTTTTVRLLLSIVVRKVTHVPGRAPAIDWSKYISFTTWQQFEWLHCSLGNKHFSQNILQ